MLMQNFFPDSLDTGIGPAWSLAVEVITLSRPSPYSNRAFRSSTGFIYHADLFAFGMAVAVLRVNIEDGVVTLPKWWRKAAALTLAGLVLATVILVDPGFIVTFRGAVPTRRSGA